MTLTYQEVIELCDMIIAGNTYREIRKSMKISYSTINKYKNKISNLSFENVKIVAICEILNIIDIEHKAYIKIIDMIIEKLNEFKKDHG